MLMILSDFILLCTELLGHAFYIIHTASGSFYQSLLIGGFSRLSAWKKRFGIRALLMGVLDSAAAPGRKAHFLTALPLRHFSRLSPRCYLLISLRLHAPRTSPTIVAQMRYIRYTSLREV